jgi:Tol biopolymer transport system component
MARFEVFPPPSSRLAGFQLSPDGRRLVVATKNQLWVRSFDALRFEALPDTEGATMPFWSADGRSIGFFAEGFLKTVPVTGGLSQPLCGAPDARGGTWNSGGVILFASRGGLFRVAQSGGAPVPALPSTGSTEGMRFAFPEFLPDGRSYLFAGSSDTKETTGVYISSLEGSKPERVLPDESSAAFVSVPRPNAIGSSDRAGYLLFRRSGALTAQSFDPFTRRVSGEVHVVAEALADSSDRSAAFSVARNGAIIYGAAGGSGPSTLGWVERSGGPVRAFGPPGPFSSARLSPDGKRLAFVLGGETGDPWLMEVPGGNTTQIGSSAATSGVAWSPNSDQVAIDLATPSSALVLRRVDPPRSDTALPPTGLRLRVNDWSADGKWIVFEQDGGQKATDLWFLPLRAQDTPAPLVYSDGDDRDAALSPDSRFVAYVQEDAGRPDIFVQSFPAPGGKVRVSTGGGTAPRWSRDGRELFYQSLDDKLVAVPVTLGRQFESGEPRALFDLGAARFQQAAQDGRRFLVVAPVDGERPLTLIQNWAP